MFWVFSELNQILSVRFLGATLLIVRGGGGTVPTFQPDDPGSDSG